MKNLITTTAAAAAILLSGFSTSVQASQEEIIFDLTLDGGLGIDGEPNFDPFDLLNLPEIIILNPSDISIQTSTGDLEGLNINDITVAENITFEQDSNGNFILVSPVGEGNPFVSVNNVPLASLASEEDADDIGNGVGLLEFFFEEPQPLFNETIVSTSEILTSVTFGLEGSNPQASFTLFSVDPLLGEIIDEIDQGETTITFSSSITQGNNEVLDITLEVNDEFEFIPNAVVPEPSTAIALISLGLFGLHNRIKRNSKSSNNN